MKVVPRTSGASPFHCGTAPHSVPLLRPRALPWCWAASWPAPRPSIPPTIDDIILRRVPTRRSASCPGTPPPTTAQSVQVAQTSKIDERRVPRDAVTFAATVGPRTPSTAASTVTPSIDGLQEDTAYSYRVGGDGGWSATYEFKTQKFDGDVRLPVLRRPADRLLGQRAQGRRRAGRTRSKVVARGEPRTPSCSSRAATRSRPPTSRRSGTRSSRPTSCAGSRGSRRSATTTSAARRTTSTSGRRTPTARRRSTAATRAPSPAVTTATSTRTSCSSTSTATPTPAACDDAKRTSSTSPTSIKAHGAEAKYTVLVYHHSIYSPAAHANDGDDQERRRDFPTAFSDLGVDLVLQGHDHIVLAQLPLKNGEKADAAEQPGAAQVVQGPGGVVYVTGNSASGSKYYDLTRRGWARTSVPTRSNPDKPLGELGREPGARPHLRQGPGARRHARGREHPQRHVRRAQRGGRARPGVLVRSGQRRHAGAAGRLGRGQRRHPQVRRLAGDAGGGKPASSVTTQQDTLTVTTID